MKRILLFTFALLLSAMTIQAQDRTISGKVTAKEDGSPLPGVSVVIKGTTKGSATDADGNYTVSVPADATHLVFSFIGFADTEEEIGGRTTINVALGSDDKMLEEIIVTGVAGGTSSKKLGFSVGKVKEELLQQVPAVNAAQSLQGKVAGVTVVSGSGLPGSAPAIRLRGATSLVGGQAPLIILDGVLLEGSLADINAEDIESMEVLKGASASSLYGSRAANGVIQIFTKRGAKNGQTVVKVRSEYGMSWLTGKVPLSNSHHYLLNGDGSIKKDATGGLAPDPDGFADNKFPQMFDQTDFFYGSNPFHTEYVSVAGTENKVNFLISFQNTGQDGVLKFDQYGYGRQNIRVNVDYDITKKLSLSTSNLISTSSSVDPNTGTGTPFYTLLFMPPHIDLTRPNQEDGSPYDWNAPSDGWPSSETNPLYELANLNNKTEKFRVITNMKLNYQLTDWLGFEAAYGSDFVRDRGSSFVDKNWLDESNSTFLNGFYSRFIAEEQGETYSLTASFNKTFDLLNIKAKLNYFAEEYHQEGFSAQAQQLGVLGIPDLSNGKQESLSVGSYIQDIRARNISAIIAGDYKDRYIFDAMVRQDEVSLFGSEARQKVFYRVSGAYRISEDISIPNIQELKIRGSYGTAGLRPTWSAQYETYTLSQGTTSKNTLGNKNLGPYFSTDLEFGLDVEFLDRFNFSATYAGTNNEGQVVPVPLAAPSGGFTSQWRNAGSLESVSYEASLGVNVMRKKDINWDFNLLFTRNEQKITKLERPELQIGPQNAFLLKEGESFGIFYGETFYKSLSELPESMNQADHEVNDEGFVVKKGVGLPLIVKDAAGNPIQTKIGDINHKFNMALNTTFRWKGLTVYALFDWKNGGDVYNLTKQWTLRELRHQIVDQAGKAESAKKTVDYYSTLYNINKTTSYFVEDGSYIKLRELNVNYALPKSWLQNATKGFVKSANVGVVGRNLFMISNYSGIDPEVTVLGDGDQTNFMFDGFGYPNFQTLTGSISLTF